MTREHLNLKSKSISWVKIDPENISYILPSIKRLIYYDLQFQFIMHIKSMHLQFFKNLFQINMACELYIASACSLRCMWAFFKSNPNACQQACLLFIVSKVEVLKCQNFIMNSGRVCNKHF